MVFTKIEKIIMTDGWKLVRIIGSQYQYQKAGCELTLVIPNLNDKALSIDIVKNLEKITGLSLTR